MADGWAPGITVISIGNALAGDDGIAHDVAAELARRHAHDRRLRFVRLDGEPCRLIEAWRGVPEAWVIDAMVSGCAPGSVAEIDIDEVASCRAARTGLPGSHGAGLADAIALGRVLGVLPPRLRVFGIEAETFEPSVPIDARAGGRLAGAIDHLERKLCAEC